MTVKDLSLSFKRRPLEESKSISNMLEQIDQKLIALEEFNKKNIIVFVDSSYGEVYRPSTKNGNLDGITDENDILKIDLTHVEKLNLLHDILGNRSMGPQQRIPARLQNVNADQKTHPYFQQDRLLHHE